MSKRLYDLFFATLGLVLSGPVFLLIALVVKLSDGGPVFYRQKRVGQFGRLFSIWKFRTMIVNADKMGLSITKDGDSRITRMGRILRKTKLDELPQLLNVLRGEMSFVGPRPEVPCYVERYTQAQREILNLRPGITDIATLKFRNEEQLLRSASDEEAFYVEYCIPHKIELNLLYARNATLWQDTRIIFQTLCPIPALHAAGFFHELVQLVALNTSNLLRKETSWKTRAVDACRQGALASAFGLLLTASFWLSYQLRFDFALPAVDAKQLLFAAVWIIPLQLTGLLVAGQFGGVMSYFSVNELRRGIFGLGAASAIVFGVWVNTGGAAAPPRSVILSHFLFSILSVSALRLGLRVARERYVTNQGPAKAAQRIGIVGAGDDGAALVKDLQMKSHLGIRPVLFLDDDRRTWHSRIHNIPVIGPPECLMDHKGYLQLDKVIIALPSASRKRLQEIVKVMEKAHLKYEVLPSLDQLASGEVRVSPLRPVDIQDLLGRDPVHLQKENIHDLLAGKMVMVTGAGGSIGSELCRQIVTFNPQRLLLLEQSEVQIYQIEQELNDLGYNGIVTPVVADILDLPRMRYIFEKYRPQVLFHAAAHKHVPMMESHPSEAIKNNSLGTAQLAEMALEFAVESFVLISTDKAINPTSVMGASKRLAEIYLQALQAAKPSPTKFMAVRFGNVLGSSGSVIPMFLKQIAAGGPVKITHPEVTRYFMTIPEAAGLVLQSVAQGEGGEIFVLDMGKPIKIVDLARKLIELSGFKPQEDIAIEFIGLRPGEKLFEEINYKSEDIIPTNHPKIMRLVSEPEALEEVREQLQGLVGDLHTAEPSALKLGLRKIVPEYEPCLSERDGAVVPVREKASRAEVIPFSPVRPKLSLREFSQPAGSFTT